MARQCNTHIAGEDQEGGNQARRHTDPSAVLEAASVTACAPADNPQALWPVEKRAHFNGREGYGARDTARGARGVRRGTARGIRREGREGGARGTARGMRLTRPFCRFPRLVRQNTPGSGLVVQVTKHKIPVPCQHPGFRAS